MSQYMITLRAARINKGLSLREVAKVVKKHPDTIRKYEIDSTNIPRELMNQLLDLYGVPTPDIIFFGKESDFTGLDNSKKAS